MSNKYNIDDPRAFTRPSTPQVVNKHGEPIKLSTYQKNALYKQAKTIREDLREKMCTKYETHRTDTKTVNKMLHSEFRQGDKMDTYRKAMTAIGADPKDRDTERLRRRGS